MLALGRAFSRRLPAREMSSAPAAQYLTARDQHITWHDGGVTRGAKEVLLNQRGCVVWFTGLSGSGKSTVACTLEHALYQRGIMTALLDGDNVRHGLNCNLGFCEASRAENIRRVGEVTKLFVESGVITLASFISPYRADRDRVRQPHGQQGFHRGLHAGTATLMAACTVGDIACIITIAGNAEKGRQCRARRARIALRDVEAFC